MSAEQLKLAQRLLAAVAPLITGDLSVTESRAVGIGSENIRYLYFKLDYDDGTYYAWQVVYDVTEPWVWYVESVYNSLVEMLGRHVAHLMKECL